MLISRKKKFIFIHIYKNAGTSITNALIPIAASKLQLKLMRLIKFLNLRCYDLQPYSGHIKASELVKLMGKENFKSYFSFAIVRNPFDLQVSLYLYILMMTNHYQHEIIKNLGSFDAYIKWRCDENNELQRDFVYSEDGELLVDFIGKYEDLENDFKIICDRIGVTLILPRLNVSDNRKEYQQYYTEESIELVRHAFEADFSLFGYDF